MAPKVSSDSANTVLPLQEWLKLLNGRGVDMRVAMMLAAKIYNSHNTRERLSSLTAQKLSPIIADKDQRRTVLNAVRNITSSEAYTKKRGRDSDLLEPLRTQPDVEAPPPSFEFNEISDVETLIPLTVTVNRAPVKTAWVFVVARRLGFDVEESLSIAHVYVHLSSLKHALMLGNILNKQESAAAHEELSELPGADRDRWGRKPEEKKRGPGWKGKRKDEDSAEDKVGSSQPWVGILKARIPVIERQDGTWRAIEKGIPVPPENAYWYITRAFKDYTPHILGALKLLAETYDADELNRLGMHMYNAFKPETEKWGERGILHCSRILDQCKAPVPEEAEVQARAEAQDDTPQSMDAKPPLKAYGSGSKPISTALPSSDPAGGGEGGDEAVRASSDAGSLLSDPPDVEDGVSGPPPAKRVKKEMTVEEYEAMLDAEDGEGGFLEAGDIAGHP